MEERQKQNSRIYNDDVVIGNKNLPRNIFQLSTKYKKYYKRYISKNVNNSTRYFHENNLAKKIRKYLILSAHLKILFYEGYYHYYDYYLVD